MDADRQVEKYWTEEQKKALAAKLRAHAELKEGLPDFDIPEPELAPDFIPPKKKLKNTSI